jgi:AcrR family transcriptional regulator
MPGSTASSAHVGMRRRPKERKDQVLEAARVLFGQRGYRNVSMADIADCVGITAGALYRHFANKAVLLDAVIDTSFDDLVPFEAQRDAELACVLSQACERAVTRHDAGALWWHESRHLEPDALARLRRRLLEIRRTYQRLIRAERPALSDTRARRLAFGMLSILASTSFHASPLPHPEFVALLTSACQALGDVALSAPPRRSPTPTTCLAPVSMRERLLTHAATLFAREGYDETALNDIGAAAGVTGPNLYSYFDSKADILDTVLARALNALWLLLDRVLRENNNPANALHDLVRGYTQLVLERTLLISVLMTRQHNLDETIRARQREYITEWVALLRAARPELDTPTARALVHTALAVINNTAQMGSDDDDHGFGDDITAMATAVLFNTSPPSR